MRVLTLVLVPLALAFAGCMEGGDADAGSDGHAGDDGTAGMKDDASNGTVTNTTGPGSGPSHGGTGGSGAGRTEDVLISGFNYQPPGLSIPVGTTVRWTNEDTAPHTVTPSDSTDGAWSDSKTLSKGDATSITFDKAGTYEYVCAFHASMTGSVVVA